MAKKTAAFALESDLVAAFCQCIERRNMIAAGRRHRTRGDSSTWTIYHETGGYDLILVEDQTGVQVGIEAKLVLNLKVLNQVLPDRYATSGPDYRAVLVPSDGYQRELGRICHHIGITVLTIRDMRSPYADGSRKPHRPDWDLSDHLPDERSTWDFTMHDWHPWLPVQRARLPEYVPDVVGGKPSPVSLTDWKIRAIKLLILLDARGVVTRKDMQALKLSPTRWCASSYGYLVADKEAGGYVKCSNTPDLRAQHPTNYAQIEADYVKWSAELTNDKSPG